MWFIKQISVSFIVKISVTFRQLANTQGCLCQNIVVNSITLFSSFFKSSTPPSFGSLYILMLPIEIKDLGHSTIMVAAWRPSREWLHQRIMYCNRLILFPLYMWGKPPEIEVEIRLFCSFSIVLRPCLFLKQVSGFSTMTPALNPMVKPLTTRYTSETAANSNGRSNSSSKFFLTNMSASRYMAVCILVSICAVS